LLSPRPSPVYQLEPHLLQLILQSAKIPSSSLAPKHSKILERREEEPSTHTLEWQ